VEEIHFYFAENRLQDQTPEEMEMKDEDVIYATVLPVQVQD
jgi:hypothetical protein